jgi:membrane protease YdiL (CAAX protease family)
MARILLRIALLSIGTLVLAIPVSGLQLGSAALPGAWSLASQCIITAGVGLAWWRWQRERYRAAPARPTEAVKVVALAGLSTFGVTAAWAQLVPPGEIDGLTNPESIWKISAILLAVALTAPLLEESVFRGFFLARLRHDLGAATSVLLSAAVFALAHEDPTRMGPQLFGGLLLGAIALTTGRLWLAVLAHGLFNLEGGLLYVTEYLKIPERLGPLFPVLALTLSAAAAWRLRVVLAETSWRSADHQACITMPAVTCVETAPLADAQRA